MHLSLPFYSRSVDRIQRETSPFLLSPLFHNFLPPSPYSLLFFRYSFESTIVPSCVARAHGTLNIHGLKHSVFQASPSDTPPGEILFVSTQSQFAPIPNSHTDRITHDFRSNFLNHDKLRSNDDFLLRVCLFFSIPVASKFNRCFSFAQIGL